MHSNVIACWLVFLTISLSRQGTSHQRLEVNKLKKKTKQNNWFFILVMRLYKHIPSAYTLGYPFRERNRERAGHLRNGTFLSKTEGAFPKRYKSKIPKQWNISSMGAGDFCLFLFGPLLIPLTQHSVLYLVVLKKGFPEGVICFMIIIVVYTSTGLRAHEAS